MRGRQIASWSNGSRPRPRRRRRTVRPRAEGDARRRLRRLRQTDPGALQARRYAAGLLPGLLPEESPPTVLGGPLRGATNPFPLRRQRADAACFLSSTPSGASDSEGADPSPQMGRTRGPGSLPSVRNGSRSRTRIPMGRPEQKRIPLGVEPARRLVHDEHLRVVHQTTGDRVRTTSRLELLISGSGYIGASLRLPGLSPRVRPFLMHHVRQVGRSA